MRISAVSVVLISSSHAVLTCLCAAGFSEEKSKDATTPERIYRRGSTLTPTPISPTLLVKYARIPPPVRTDHPHRHPEPSR